MGTQQTIKMWINISEYWQCQMGIIMSNRVQNLYRIKMKMWEEVKQS